MKTRIEQDSPIVVRPDSPPVSQLSSPGDSEGLGLWVVVAEASPAVSGQPRGVCSFVSELPAPLMVPEAPVPPRLEVAGPFVVFLPSVDDLVHDVYLDPTGTSIFLPSDRSRDSAGAV